VTALAEADGVRRVFGSVTAVDGVSLAVGRGEVVGLLGANGAGKTTLIRLLLGLLPPSAGSVRLFGRPPSGPARRRLGYVPQGLGLYQDLTPAENLAFARLVYGYSNGTGDAVVRDAGQVVGQLPLGRQRQVAFAEALDHGPELLILDEPTSGVSPLGSARLWETIRDATEGGAGALVSTHNLEDAGQCDRLVIMAAGRVVAQGTADSIVGQARAVAVHSDDWAAAFDRLQRAGIPAALVGTALRVPVAQAAGARAALGELAAAIEDVPATLEERFLQLVQAGSGEVTG
jgi:ABC-type multidrug transport system ATPase subunit